MKILLTGATGFLGSYLIKALLKNGHSVIALKRQSSDIARLSEIKGDVSFYDLEDGLKNLFEEYDGIEIVLHAATNYGNKGGFLSDVIEANVVMPLRLMELAYKYGNCKFINTDTFFCKADDDYAYLAGYVFSKKLFYRLGSNFSEKNKCSFINVQLEHMYGPGDGSGKFIPSIIGRMINNEAEITLTPGDQLRDFIYIDDVVNAYLSIINSKEVLSAIGVSHFELGSGVGYSIKDLVVMSHQIIGSQSKLLFGSLPYRDKEIMFSRANPKALMDIGWENKIDLKTGLSNVISSFQEEKKK